MASHRKASRASGEKGFTLVEVLVALVILAVAAAGLIGAAEAHVDSIRALEARAAAQWVAENRIVELTVSKEPEPRLSETVDMLGQSWTITLARRPSDDPELQAMTISVAPEGGPEPLVTMSFFLEVPREPVG
ncbi:MAG: type II secretion system minor pseudopilin GspI [Pseudomonadota bacterium]|nr:type II secretion system minor pseudopilin GspI [Pseudomonadota bacterium]